jgi:hypothetical protein
LQALSFSGSAQPPGKRKERTAGARRPSRLLLNPSPIDRALVRPPSLRPAHPACPPAQPQQTSAPPATWRARPRAARRTAPATRPAARAALLRRWPMAPFAATARAWQAPARVGLNGRRVGRVRTRRKGEANARNTCASHFAPPGWPMFDPHARTCADLCATNGVKCQAPVCHAAGACSPATGTCSAPTPLPAGTLCPGGSCSGGACLGEGVGMLRAALGRCRVLAWCLIGAI